MKKIKKTLSVILVVALIFSAIPLALNTAFASEGHSGWFYDQLDDTQKVFYDAIALLDFESGSDMADLTSSEETGKALTQEELARYVSGNSALSSDFASAISAYESENPALFYLDFSKLTFRVGRNTAGKYLAYVCSGSNPNYYRFAEFSTESEVNNAIVQLNEKVDRIAADAMKITGATEEETVVERIRYVHNEIINNCRYVYAENTEIGEMVYTAYGCLVMGESVCEGYSEATKLILNKIGIDCELISGLGKEVNDLTADAAHQLHMWNVVKIGGKWYGLDVTWDDPISVKRVTVNNVSTPQLDEDGNYVYNNLCREKYFLLGADSFYNDHTEDRRLSSFGKEFDLPVLSERAYGLGANESGLVVEKLSLTDLKQLYDAGILPAERYSTYAGYADFNEIKYSIGYGTTDTTISYDENSIIGTVVTHTEGSVTTTYTVVDVDTISVTVDDGQGNVTNDEWFGYMDVAKDEQFAQYTVPHYEITITEITKERNPYFAVSYNNMNESELNKNGMYLAYTSDYWDINTGEMGVSSWTPFNFFNDLNWATDIPGKTIVVGSGDGNYFAVADFYPAMLDKATTNYQPLMFGSTPYTGLIAYSQLTDWLNTDGTLNTDVFIEASEAHKGNGTIYVQPFVRVATPSQSSITRPGKTYDVSIEYDEPLKLETEGVQPSYNLSVSALAEFYSTTALDYTKITDFAWDGEKTITFKFTPSPMYNDNNCQYSFTFPGLLGRFSNLPPRYYSILVEKPTTDLNVCPRCPPSKEFSAMGTPILIEDENLENITYYDGSTVTDNAKFGLTLVASKPDELTSGIMEASVEEALGKEVLASSTYNIKLNLRNCQTPQVRPGQKVTIGLPYPDGYGPQNEGVTFKAYHYKIDDGGNYIAEELECYIGPYGLVVYVDSFSPFAVVALEMDEAAPETKSVYAISSEGGSVSPSGISSYTSSDTISYILTPDDGYVLESVLVNATESISGIVGDTLVLDYENLPASTQISAVFTAISVIETEQQLGFTPEFVQVAPHVVSDWVTVRSSCLEGGYRYTFCETCTQHEELERIYDVAPLSSHSYGEWTVITAATATQEGLEKRSCSVCSAYEQRVIAATGEETQPTQPEDEPEKDVGFFNKIIEAFLRIIEWFKNLFR